MEVTVVERLTLQQLKEQCKFLKLSAKGRKHDLQKRLINQIYQEKEINENSNDTQSCFKHNDFERLQNDYKEFKQYTFDKFSNLERILANNKVENDRLSELEAENARLKDELKNKKTVIEQLREEIKTMSQYQNPVQMKDQNNQWSRIPYSPSKRNEIEKNRAMINYRHQNQFEILEVESCTDVEVEGYAKNTKNKSNISKIKKRNGIVIEQNPERNFNKFTTTVPGNSSYANMLSKGKKVAVIGDSLVKRIRGKELSRNMNKGKAFVKSFPGATNKQLNHYVIPTLIEESPDIVVIHCGTNDINPRFKQPHLDAEKIANDMIEIGKTCRNNGVNEVFISSIVCRSVEAEMLKVDEVNKMVRDLCIKEGFAFIDNSFIGKQFLWKDGIHLLNDGTTLLANNILNSLNRNI